MSRWRDLLVLHAAYRYNRLRFALMSAQLKGRIEFGPGADVWAGNFWLTGPGRARFGPGFKVDRGPSPFVLELEQGSLLETADNVAFRGKYRPNVVTLFENARMSIGPGSLINGAIISAKESVTIGARAEISWNVTILDSNLHPLENGAPVKTKPVTIGDQVIVFSGATILPGARIGSHVVIGANSIVSGDIPDHVIAAGSPAKVIREIGDRDLCP